MDTFHRPRDEHGQTGPATMRIGSDDAPRLRNAIARALAKQRPVR